MIRDWFTCARLYPFMKDPGCGEIRSMRFFGSGEVGDLMPIFPWPWKSRRWFAPDLGAYLKVISFDCW